MLYGFIALSVLSLIIAIMLLYAKSKNIQKGKIFKNYSDERGFEYATSRLFQLHPVIKGVISNLQFEIFEEIEGYGKSKTTYTKIKFPKSSFDFDFKISKEHFISKLGKLFGFHDIEFRNDKFDSRFLLKSRDENKFRQIMNDRTQTILMEMEDGVMGTIENTNGQLIYTSYREITDQTKMDQLDQILNFLIDFQNQKI